MARFGERPQVATDFGRRHMVMPVATIQIMKPGKATTFPSQNTSDKGISSVNQPPVRATTNPSHATQRGDPNHLAVPQTLYVLF